MTPLTIDVHQWNEAQPTMYQCMMKKEDRRRKQIIYGSFYHQEMDNSLLNLCDGNGLYTLQWLA